jgi:ABC-type sugar transport system permease subunit
MNPPIPIDSQTKGNTMNTVSILVHTQNLVADAVTALSSRFQRERNENGEGVISAAIAVLIMATIGALMYVSYAALFNNSARKTSDLVDLSSVAPVIVQTPK